jgi:hypothetical protein
MTQSFCFISTTTTGARVVRWIRYKNDLTTFSLRG